MTPFVYRRRCSRNSPWIIPTACELNPPGGGASVNPLEKYTKTTRGESKVNEWVVMDPVVDLWTAAGRIGVCAGRVMVEWDYGEGEGAAAT